jgi:hypothetical protein
MSRLTVRGCANRPAVISIPTTIWLGRIVVFFVFWFELIANGSESTLIVAGMFPKIAAAAFLSSHLIV